MTILLLVVIYIAFVGLGIPDSLFGTAWPAIYPELNLPVSAANYVTFLISCGTVFSSLMSARVINRFGTAVVTAASTAMTAAALLGFMLSNSLVCFCLLAIPLGLGAGAVDSGLNNYLALHYKASHMSYLHCAYGVGVSLSPYLMSVALAGPEGWRGGYMWAFTIQAVITAVTVVSLPLWKKVQKAELAENTNDTGKNADTCNVRTVGFAELFKNPCVRASALVFFGSCSLEFTCGIWGSTFLVNNCAVSVEAAAAAVTFYYVGMALGRFLSGVFADKISSEKIIIIGQIITFTGAAALIFPIPPAAAAAMLFLIGLGNAPIFPNMIHLTPKNFGADVSQSVVGVQMAAANTGIMIMPPLFGLMAQYIGVSVFAPYLLVLFAIMAAGSLILSKRLHKNSKSL